MDAIWITISGLLYGLSLLFAYRQGMRDGKGEKTPHKPILPPIRKPKPELNQEEKAALERERRINDFKG